MRREILLHSLFSFPHVFSFRTASLFARLLFLHSFSASAALSPSPGFFPLFLPKRGGVREKEKHSPSSCSMAEGGGRRQRRDGGKNAFRKNAFRKKLPASRGKGSTTPGGACSFFQSVLLFSERASFFFALLIFRRRGGLWPFFLRRKGHRPRARKRRGGRGRQDFRRGNHCARLRACC